ncbi:MAG: DUF3488 and transglutaminase-like domain-containing protein [Verrucomicrobia bacterium]|nr:DUF3488 and transglutaminase-like domain-containing protein [Verrucomicrobiota bacterium]
MANPRPQLNLAELHQLRWLLGGVIALLAAWSVFYLDIQAWLPLALITVTVPLVVWKPWLAQRLPAWFHRLAFPVIGAVLAADLWFNREPFPGMVRLALLLLAYRCVAPRGRREDLQLILLSLFMVVITGVFTVSPLFVVQILAFSAASLALMLAVTLSDARSAGAAGAEEGAAGGWTRVRWPVFFARLRAAADMRVLGLGALLFAGLVGLSAVFFLALPRFELSNSLFLDKLIARKSKTGFSENVKFGDVVDIIQDRGTAFNVDVSDPSAVPAMPYWRMLVLDEYSGSGFKMSQGLRLSFDRTGERAATYSGNRGRREGAVVWQVYFPSGVSRYLPLLGDFSRLAFEGPQELEFNRALRLAALKNEPSKMLPYQVTGMEFSGRLADPDFAREKRQQFAQTPKSSEGAKGATLREPTFLELDGLAEPDQAQLRGWVTQLGGVGRGGEEFARRAAQWLQARHSYSLSSTMPEGGGDDVLVRWMGSNTPGHCELFAGGMVLLARAGGVPARMVTGFKGGAWNAVSGSITVRNSDAHAWTEVWDEATGAWVLADATPGSALTPAAEEAAVVSGATRLQADSGWNARLDALRVFWYRRIVNFDEGSQRELLRGTKNRLQEAMKAWRARMEDRMRAAAAWAREPWGFSRGLALALVAGGMTAGVWWWRRKGRAGWLAWRSRRAGEGRSDPVRREAAKWLRKLERARPAKDAEGEAARREVREALLRLRFGSRESWHEPVAVFQRARRAWRRP